MEVEDMSARISYTVLEYLCKSTSEMGSYIRVLSLVRR